MTSGWSGNRYAGIPAGTVSPVGTMQPNTVTPVVDTMQLNMRNEPGLSYYFMRGREGLYGAFVDDALYDPQSLIPKGCLITPGCGGVPPMEYCRTLQCPRASAPFSSGCVTPN